MQEFDQFWSIYANSFPQDERRDKEAQQLVTKNSRYRIVPYYKDDCMIAFISLWDLDDFLFIEHFAVKKEYRGNGHGTRILHTVEEKYKKKVVLEVEPPKDIVAEKRIAFYKRSGFHLNHYHYIQPAYKKGQKSVRMNLMSYPAPLLEHEADRVIKSIHEHVYNL